MCNTAWGLGISRRASVSGLSSRRPMKRPWRISPSGVQSAKAISATSTGFTQITPRRKGAGTGQAGPSRRFSSRQVASWPSTFVRKSGADAAGIAQAFGLLHTHQQRRKRAGRLCRRGEADDDEFLAMMALDLQPIQMPPGAVGGGGALGDQPFQPVVRKRRRARAARIAGKNLAELQRRLRSRRAQQALQQGAAACERKRAHILALVNQDIEQETGKRGRGTAFKCGEQERRNPSRHCGRSR